MKNYGYSKFANKVYDLVHSSGFKVGDTIMNFELLNLEGQKVNFSDYFDKLIVFETSSQYKLSQNVKSLS